MAFSREIFLQAKNKIAFQQSEKEKDSHYTVLGKTLVRISNHCTWMCYWDEFLEKNPKYKGLPIISIVFEDGGDTFDEEQCLTLKRYRMKPIKVAEHVFPIHGNGQYINKEDVNKIIASIKEIGTSQKFNDRTGKSQYFPRISKNPSNASINPDNNQIKENQNIMKKTIKLTESYLSKIIKEALNELDWKNYANAAKKAEEKGDPRKDKFLKYATDRIKSQYPNRKYNNLLPGSDISSSGSFNPYLNTRYGYINSNGNSGEYDTEYHKSFGDKGVKGWGKSPLLALTFPRNGVNQIANL